MTRTDGNRLVRMKRELIRGTDLGCGASLIFSVGGSAMIGATNVG